MINDFVYYTFKGLKDLDYIFDYWTENCKKFLNHAQGIHGRNMELAFPDIYNTKDKLLKENSQLYKSEVIYLN